MVYQLFYTLRNSCILNYESWVMRTALIGSVVGIVFACVLLGMSEIAQPTLAIVPKVSTKSGAGAWFLFWNHRQAVCISTTDLKPLCFFWLQPLWGKAWDIYQEQWTHMYSIIYIARHYRGRAETKSVLLVVQFPGQVSSSTSSSVRC
jgi:hypothetical protein